MDKQPDLFTPPPRPPPVETQPPPPTDPAPRCHCGAWAWWGFKDEWRCHEHRAEIGFDLEGKWRDA